MQIVLMYRGRDKICQTINTCRRRPISTTFCPAQFFSIFPKKLHYEKIDRPFNHIKYARIPYSGMGAYLFSGRSCRYIFSALPLPELLFDFYAACCNLSSAFSSISARTCSLFMDLTTSYGNLMIWYGVPSFSIQLSSFHLLVFTQEKRIFTFRSPKKFWIYSLF